MDLLAKATAEQLPITFHSDEGGSVAVLVPMVHSSGGINFKLSSNAARHLRITAGGKVDMNGGRNGAWTEFKVTPNKDGRVCLQGVKSSQWLTVVSGEFVASGTLQPLLPQFATIEVGDDENVLDEKQSSAVSLRPVGGGPVFSIPVRICKKGNHVLLVTDTGNFACGENGNFHSKGGEGKWAQWDMDNKDEGVSFKNMGHGGYLALSESGTARFSDTPCIFSMGSHMFSPLERVPPPPVNRDAMSDGDIAHFREHGYVVLRGAVAPELVRDALHAINNQLGKPGCWVVDSNPLNGSQLALKLPGIGKDIVNKSSRFWSALNILLGEGNIDPIEHGQQVALRFPQDPILGNDVPDIRKGTGYHIDGMGQNKLCPFSLLCGVALSDQSKPNCGNLHVFPGSHLNESLHKYYLDKIDDDSQGESDESKPDLGTSTQVLLQPGDVVLAHQLLAHRVGVNTSEHIRYQLYYRVRHKNHADLKARIVHEPWAEFAC